MKVASIYPKAANTPFHQGKEATSFDIARRLETPIWVFDIDNARIAFANKAACRLWQADNEEALCARDMSEGMSSTVSKRLSQYQNDFRESDASFTELWTLYPNGEPKSVMVVYRAFVLADGRMAMLCEAIGETDNTPQNLRSAEALLHTDVMISLYSKDGPPLYSNPAARNASAMPNTNFAALFVDFADYRSMLDQLDIVGEHRLVTKVHTSGGQRWFDLSAKYCSDAATGAPAILLTAIDVSELKEARDTARHLADRDQLTGLHNRAYLQNHLSKLATRPTTGRCALVFFDVDRFKLINDRYGHDAGDTVLKSIAERTRSILRAGDLVARLGGDEFVVLLEDINDDADVEMRTERLNQSIAKPVAHAKTLIDITISIGISVFEPCETDFNEVLREADIALYASKQSGRDRATFFTDEMGKAAKARDDMEVELAHAVERDEFVLHYQPRLDIKTGQVVAVEGLVRWNHPKRGLIMPNDFIPVCEETGLIEALGRRVLEIGCKQAIDWHRAGLTINVSLNVSPRQFGDDTLLDTLSDLASLPGFPSGKIELEITENVLSGDHQMIADKLQKITEMGYRIAIDDFGTGYSNLSYISRFPLTCLKIDRSFIDQLPDSGPIIRLILTLGQQVGATVVSEGVETIAQLDWLAKNNCDQAQGYLITRPLALEQFVAYLNHSA